jgi:hypothetical protein
MHYCAPRGCQEWRFTAANQEVSRVVVRWHFRYERSLRFVESKYKLEINTAQVTQLSKALQKGAENNVFLLPKGKYFGSTPVSNTK